MTIRNRLLGFVLFVLASVAVALTGDMAGPPTDVPGTWTGNSDVNWNNAANWSDNVVPTSSIDVTIPTGCPRYPTTNTGAAYYCHSLQIQSGASLTFVSGKSLQTSYLVNSGTVTCGGASSLGDVVNNAGANLILGSGSTTYSSDYIENYGSFTNNGVLSGYPSLLNSGSFTNTDSCQLDGVENEAPGLFLNSPDGFIDVVGGLWSGSVIVNHGRMDCSHIYDDDSLYNDGVLTAYALEGDNPAPGVPAVLVNDVGGYLSTEYEFYMEGRVVNRGVLLPGGYFEAEVLHNGGVVRCTTEYGEFGVYDTLVNDDTIDIGPRGGLYTGDIAVNNRYIRLGQELNVDGTFSSGPGSVLHVDGDEEGYLEADDSGIALDTLRVTKTTPCTVSVWVDHDYALCVASKLKVTGGCLLLEEQSHLTLGTASASGVVDVSGGGFCVVGDSDELAVVEAKDVLHPYSFTVSAGATVGAKFCRFSGMDASGLRVLSGANISAARNFSGCSFVGSAAGPMLKVESSQPLTLANVSFSGSATYNIEKLGASGRITVSGGLGSRWGEDFDNDPNNLVDWTGRSTAVWTELATVPGVKGVKDGGWLVRSLYGLLAANGNKTSDVSSYLVLGDSWHRCAPIPDGREAKKPGKGGTACSDGERYAWATKGNNTAGFWRYDMQGDSWGQRQDVPLGLSNKKVKGGTDLVDVLINRKWYVYLLKGYKCEFLRYDPATDSWRQLPDAPTGAKGKWDKGSFLVWDENNTIYAHKSKYHEFYAYDITTNTWSSALPAMPIPGSTGSKKSKDGGCGTWAEDKMIALKGGNTQQCWAYFPGGGWVELDTIPKVSRSGKGKKVKAGADIAYRPWDRAVYALKGAGTFELWKYTLPLMSPEPTVPREGVMGDAAVPCASALVVGPNPAKSGLVHVRYALPVAGQAEVRVFDASGREVATRAFTAGRSGTLDVDLSTEGAGVYIVKMSARDWTATQKLVVQR